MDIGKPMEPTPQVELSGAEVPETSDGSSNADVEESDNTEMVVEESSSPFSSPPLNTEIQSGASPGISDSDSFGSPENILCLHSHEHKALTAEVEPEDDHSMDTEEDRILNLEEEEDTVDATEEDKEPSTVAEEPLESTMAEETEKDTIPEDETEDQTQAEGDQTLEDMMEEKEDDIVDSRTMEDAMAENEDDEVSQTMEPEASVQTGAAGETAGSSVLEDSTEADALPEHLEDSETVSAAVEEPAQRYTPAPSRSKTAVRRRISKPTGTKLTPKVPKAKSSKVSVPTVMVTAPSDQSDDSEAGKSSTPSSNYNTNISGLPRRIESSDKLPSGWLRVTVMRLGGKFIGKYDTTIFSDTKFKMRSFPNVRDYLVKQGLQHYLEDDRYDFKCRQPFSTPRGKDVKDKQHSHVGRATPQSPAAGGSVKAKNKTPTTGSAKAVKSDSAKNSKSKSPASGSKKPAHSDSSTPSVSKVCVTLKRKIHVCSEELEEGPASMDLDSIWEIKKPSKVKASPKVKTSPKARKRTTPGSKKDSPQLKLDAFITRHKPPQAAPAATQSKFKSSFKTVLQKNLKKSREDVTTEAAEQQISASPPRTEEEPCGDTTSEKSAEEVEETAHDADTASDEHAVQDTDQAEVVLDEDKNRLEAISDEGVNNAEVISDEGVNNAEVISDEEEDKADAISNEGVDRPEVVTDDDDAEKEDNETVSDVYLADEQEEPYRSEDEEEVEAYPEEDNVALPAGSWSQDMEEEETKREEDDINDDDANKGAVSAEDCSSEEESDSFELKSEESDNSSVPTPTPTQETQESPAPHHPTININDDDDDDAKLADPMTSGSVHVTSNKRSLSPSDSDVSACKRARLWREEDAEEDSSRSAGMASDLSLPGGAGAGGEEDENQNMMSKVQTLHLWDSSSSMKDSASTSSSNSGSLMVPTSSSQLLSPPAWAKASRVRGGGGGGGGTVSPPRVLGAGWKRSSLSAAQADTTTAASSSTSAVDADAGDDTFSSDTSDNVSAAEDSAAAVNTNGGSTPGREGGGRVRRDTTWTPPRSPFNLIQERLFHDPWKMLVATIIMQELQPEVGIPLLWKFLNRWPTAEQVRSVDRDHIARMLRSMHRNQATAATLVRFSVEYLNKDWEYPMELHGISKYGDDSYRIFCVREWDQVEPDDKKLSSYCRWLSQNREELGLE